MKKRLASVKDFIKKWAVLAIGVSLTILSAIISNYSIEQNNDVITELEKNAKNSGQLIAEIWQNSRYLEARKDNAIMLNVISPDHPDTIMFTNETLRLLGQTSMKNGAYSELNLAFNLYKETVVDKVNETYFEQQDYLAMAKETKVNNDVLLNIALCLQFLGVIFVLSKGYY